jgi:predicted  nucleic acid-binding Zn-ribbon protein
MANIKPYLDNIANAEYGEDVRGSLINALIKVNDDNDSYNDLKEEVIAARDDINDQVDQFDEKMEAASEISKKLEEDTASGNQTHSDLTNSITIAQNERSKLESAYENVGKVVESANKKKDALDASISSANTAKANLDDSVTTATTTKKSLDETIQTSEQRKKNLDSSVTSANKIFSNLNDAITSANNAKSNLTQVTDSADSAKTALSEVIDSATATKSIMDASVKSATTANTNLSESIKNAITAKNTLQGVIDSASEIKGQLDSSNATAVTSKKNLDASVATANNVLQSLSAENASAASNIDELKSENFNSQEILSGVADIRAYLGITADDIVGIQVDYKNKTFKRLAVAANLSKGSDFDKFTMFGGRKRCNVADDGSIVAWYGDADYKEDGSMGQVMVYQPKFYYLVCPVEYDPIDTGIGYHLRKANYYVSEKPRAGFRLHPAFYDASGNEIDYFLTSAYEGSIYDASASAYLLNDEQVMNTGEDKFSSIAGARPASGSSQNLTRPNIEAMAQNRGTNWHGDLIKQVSAEQMLMIVEMGVMNLQTAIAQGIVSLPWTTGSDTTSSYAAVTGSTASLGNGTGRAEKTTTYEGGVAKEYTVDGKTSVCWRGKENFWGNLWKFVYGINIWGNGKMGGGQPYICSDFSFAESKNSGNYEPAGFIVTNANGYISAMGYSTACDWLFIASECLGNSSLPVGDYTYVTTNLNDYRIARLGGYWNVWDDAGGFYWALYSGVGSRDRIIGGRLVYIPTRDSATYTAAIEAWKQKMAA